MFLLIFLSSKKNQCIFLVRRPQKGLDKVEAGTIFSRGFFLFCFVSWSIVCLFLPVPYAWTSSCSSICARFFSRMFSVSSGFLFSFFQKITRLLVNVKRVYVSTVFMSPLNRSAIFSAIWLSLAKAFPALACLSPVIL